jgi:hypothetical protein
LLVAAAEGAIRPPDGLSVRHLGNRRVQLAWRNRDSYRAIEIRRQPPGRFAFERLSCDGSRQAFEDELPEAAEGAWTYELLAVGHGRRTMSPRVVLQLDPEEEQ